MSATHRALLAGSEAANQRTGRIIHGDATADAWSERAFDQQKARAEAAEAEAARLRDGLRDLESAVRVLDVMLREPAAKGLMSAEEYRSYVQGAWLGVDEAAEKAREALAGPDAQTSGSGSSAADPSVGERQGRQPDPGEIAGLLVELSRWSRVAELNGDLHARIASALAEPDTPAESQEPRDESGYPGLQGLEAMADSQPEETT